MLSDAVVEELHKFVDSSSSSPEHLLAEISKEQQKTAKTAEDTRQSLEEAAAWFRSITGEDLISPIDSSENQLAVYKQRLLLASNQLAEQLTEVSSLLPELERILAGLQHLHSGTTPQERFRGYFQAREELLGQWSQAEWAVAAEERLAATAQTLHDLLFKAFSESPKSFFELATAEDLDPRTAQAFLLDFYGRLLAETVEGRLPSVSLLTFKVAVEGAFNRALEEQLLAVTERVLEAKAAIFSTQLINGRISAAEFDRFLACATELGFAALAVKARSQTRLRLHSPALDRLVAAKNLLAAFFEREAITGDEFLIAVEAVAPCVESAEELLGLAGQPQAAVVVQEYTTSFYTLLLFYVERHAADCATRLPHARFAARLRRAAQSAVELRSQILFSRFAAAEFRWLRATLRPTQP